jgi:hypothetical protein
MLLVTPDTFQIARQIDHMEALLTKEATDKVELLRDMVKANVAVDALL